MTAEMKSRLDRLRAIAPRLNRATTEAGKMIEATEKFLAELSIGITVQSPIGSRPPAADDVEGEGDEIGGRDEIDTRLVYGKLNGAFRFFIRDVLTRQDDAGYWQDIRIMDETPWPSCPRELKLRSFEKLPGLLEAMATEAENLSALAEGTADVVADLIGAPSAEAEVSCISGGNRAEVVGGNASAFDASKGKRTAGRTTTARVVHLGD